MKMWQHWLGLAIEADELAAMADRAAARAAAEGDMAGRDAMRREGRAAQVRADRARYRAARGHQEEERTP